MNENVKSRWIEALESGKYKQGKEQLRSNDCFCCLGVLCDLHRIEFKGEWVGDRYLGSLQILPMEVWTWAGFNTDNPTAVNLKNPDLDFNPECSYDEYSLAELNDEGYSFRKLVKIIKEI